VLIGSAARVASVRTDFAAAREISRDWPDSMAASRKDYLAAVLQQLSAQLEGSR
jgi:hypothetical protein